VSEAFNDRLGLVLRARERGEAADDGAVEGDADQRPSAYSPCGCSVKNIVPLERKLPSAAA